MVGIVAAGIVLPWTVWTLVRGFRDGQLPIGRGAVRRDQRPAPFRLLMALYAAAAVIAAVIALDLLFGIAPGVQA